MDAFNQNFGKIVEKAWNDEAFKQRLMSHPREVLGEHGIEVPAGVNVKVLENSEGLRHFVLPAKPTAHLSEDQLDMVAGGSVPENCDASWVRDNTNNNNSFYQAPTNTDFSTASGLGTSGSGFKLDK